MPGAVPANDQYALIIGAMKSGTSALFDLLVQHPQICPSAIKEPEFFSVGQGHGMRVPRYSDLWDFDPALHRIALEASTGYAKHPAEEGVPARIAAAGLRPFFIYVLRDPIARIESQVAYSNWGRREAVADFTDEHALSISRYAMQLDQYVAVFPRERILLVDHARLARDPAAVAGETFRFLGLDAFVVEPAAERKNVARPRSDWERRLMANGRLARLASAAPSGMKSGLRRASAKGSSARPQMPADVAEQLRRALTPDMERLQAEWGFDTSVWGFGAGRGAEAS